MPIRPQFSNKGTFGKVLNFCGSNNYRGAAYLATISSLKIGAGLSALASESEVIDSVVKLLPEAVYYNREDGLKMIHNYTVVLIGCGLSTEDSAVELFKKVITKLENSEIPVVIDADGLNILSTLNEISLPKNLIITPHPAEAARLLKCGINEVLGNLEEAAMQLTKKYNCVTVLKTHRTIICNKNLDIHINQNGNSALAKAGSGDVLAGMISGLLAQNIDLFEAAKLGVYLHSISGELASKDLTEYSVLARDIIDYLPQAIKTVI